MHGGLTYSDFCQEENTSEFAICHVPQSGKPDLVWWLGFDCGHAGDFVPAYSRLREKFGRFSFAEYADTYKTVAYVKQQCGLLALQLAAIAQKKESLPGVPGTAG